jgi:nucleoside-diphosphate-sugar epimerase
MAFDSTNKGYHALVFGASGITGWAIMNNALMYPSPNTFERIVGLTHRPLSAAESQLPQVPRIELYSGIDLSKRDTIIQKLQEVREIEKITHVYFAAYTGHGNDFQELKRANMEILSNAVEAVEVLCPKLIFFTLQTGGKVLYKPHNAPSPQGHLIYHPQDP